MLYLSSYTIHVAFFFHRPSNRNNNELSLLLFDGSCKVKATYTVLCLTSLAKIPNVNGATSPPPALISNCRIAVIFLNSVNQVSSLLLVYLRWCAEYEVPWPPGRCIVK